MRSGAAPRGRGKTGGVLGYQRDEPPAGISPADPGILAGATMFLCLLARVDRVHLFVEIHDAGTGFFGIMILDVGSCRFGRSTVNVSNRTIPISKTLETVMPAPSQPRCFSRNLFLQKHRGCIWISRELRIVRRTVSIAPKARRGTVSGSSQRCSRTGAPRAFQRNRLGVHPVRDIGC